MLFTGKPKRANKRLHVHGGEARMIRMFFLPLSMSQERSNGAARLAGEYGEEQRRRCQIRRQILSARQDYEPGPRWVRKWYILSLCCFCRGQRDQ